MHDDFLNIKKALPKLGVGLGYREPLEAATLANEDSIDFLELMSEHYISDGPTENETLERINHFRLIPHGLELSIGNCAELDYEYLGKLKTFLKKIDAPWWSDHLCFTGTERRRLHDLLPLPFSMEAVKHVAERVQKVQEFIGIPLLLENISSYIRTPGSELNEAQFIGEIAERANCGLLLDVNNVYVNSFNHQFDAKQFINDLPLDRVVQIHIAGHKKLESVIIDTHGAKIADPVYELLELTLRKTEVNAILLERDQYFPRFASILTELQKIRNISDASQARKLSTAAANA
jgi:uncharacterized protein (UPF0276 family)